MPLVSPGSGTRTPDTEDEGGGAGAKANGAEQDHGGRCAAPAAVKGCEGASADGGAMRGPRVAGAVPNGDAATPMSMQAEVCIALANSASVHVVACRPNTVVVVPPTSFP